MLQPEEEQVKGSEPSASFPPYLPSAWRQVLPETSEAGEERVSGSMGLCLDIHVVCISICVFVCVCVCARMRAHACARGLLSMHLRVCAQSLR